MADLTTLIKFKQYLGLNNGTDDVLIGRLITSESAGIESWLNRVILSASYTHVCSGNGGDTLLLPNYPITAISTLSIDGVAIAASTGVTVAGYVFDEHRVGLRGYVFAKGMMNISITYTAGYATVPSDIEQACNEMVGLSYRERDRLGLASKGIAGEQTNFITAEMTNSVKSILNQYKRVIPV